MGQSVTLHYMGYILAHEPDQLKIWSQGLRLSLLAKGLCTEPMADATIPQICNGIHVACRVSAHCMRELL